VHDWWTSLAWGQKIITAPCLLILSSLSLPTEVMGGPAVMPDDANLEAVIKKRI
jgi:hypothetical protein